jgi:hypothetical protein
MDKIKVEVEKREDHVKYRAKAPYHYNRRKK